MLNQSMKRSIEEGRCIDVSKFAREGRLYVLPSFEDGQDYCDAQKETWIWSIGRRKSDGVILASTSGSLYENDEFDCLWLR